MRHTTLVLAAMTAAVLAACGGNSGKPNPGDQSTKVKFSSQVSFGDSLSDVGSYAVGTVKTLGGGKFTVNGSSGSAPETAGKNWTEYMAAMFGLPAPCAAQTGLDGNAAKGFSVPVVNHAGCYGYAQGGARVTNPVGQDNKLTGSEVGALTVPIVTQVKNHLSAVGGKFKGDEVVFLMPGGGDILFNLGSLSASATAAGTAAGKTAFATSLATQLAAGATTPATAAQAIGAAIATESARAGSTDATIVAAAVAAAVKAGNTAAGSATVYGPMVTKAQADAATAGATAGANYFAAEAPKVVAAMTAAAKEFVALVKTQVLANGAKYVVVNNLADVSITPRGRAASAATRELIVTASNAFNNELASGLAGLDTVLVVDVFYVSHDQSVNPGPYGLTNNSDPACDLSLAKNPLGSSLACTAANLVAGDTGRYAFADSTHPTPYNNWLLARYVSEKMVVKGWL